MDINEIKFGNNESNNSPNWTNSFVSGFDDLGKLSITVITQETQMLKKIFFIAIISFITIPMINWITYQSII
jgi:hypothetical protein